MCNFNSLIVREEKELSDLRGDCDSRGRGRLSDGASCKQGLRGRSRSALKVRGCIK